MSKSITIEIPTTITVGAYIQFGTLDHLSDTERIVKIISVIASKSEDEVKTWAVADISKIYKDLNKRLEDTEPTFLPAFEWGNQLWGFQPLHKMSAGEYIDLETYLKDGVKGLPNVLSILYRPITKNRLDGLKWKIMKNIKYVIGKSENLFKYYDIEEYDIEKQEYRKNLFKTLPISVALGAYSFFLSTGQILLKDLATSFRKEMKGMKKEDKEEFQRLLNTTVGSEHFMDLLKKVEYSN